MLIHIENMQGSFPTWNNNCFSSDGRVCVHLYAENFVCCVSPSSILFIAWQCIQPYQHWIQYWFSHNLDDVLTGTNLRLPVTICHIDTLFITAENFAALYLGLCGFLWLPPLRMINGPSQREEIYTLWSEFDWKLMCFFGCFKKLRIP